MDLAALKFLLKKYQLTPNKLRGQNFLYTEEILKDIVQAAALTKDDLVIEVGPGLGSLTSLLTAQAKKVIAFEVDKNFSEALNKLALVAGNLEIIWQDILSVTDGQLTDILKKEGRVDYKIVANIPYYLTGKFINKFILSAVRPKSITLTIQAEVAERIIAKNKKQSLLSLAVAFYAQAKLVKLIAKDNFYPVPDVNSAIITIFDIKPWAYPVAEKKTWQLIKRGFAFKRKKLLNNLASDPDLDKDKLRTVFNQLKLDPNIRAEVLSLNNWLDLAKNLYKN